MGLLDCTDAGPWKCSIEGCPAPLQGCDSLASLRFCDHNFDSVWSPAPEGVEPDTLIRDLCPRACHMCGVEAPSHCSMRKLLAATLSTDDLVEALLTSTSPVVVKWSVDAASEMRRLLKVHGTSLRVAVVTQGGRYRGDSTSERPISYGDFAPALQNRSLPDDSYVFYELGGLHTQSDLRGRSGRLELAGAEVSPEARQMVDGSPYRPSPTMAG